MLKIQYYFNIRLYNYVDIIFINLIKNNKTFSLKKQKFLYAHSSSQN